MQIDHSQANGFMVILSPQINPLEKLPQYGIFDAACSTLEGCSQLALPGGQGLDLFSAIIPDYHHLKS